MNLSGLTSLPRPILAIALLLPVLAAAGPAMAQSQPPAAAAPVNRPADPADIQRRIEQSEPARRQPERDLDLPETPVPAPAPSPAREAGEALIRLEAVEVEGATVFTEEELASFYRLYLGEEITLADVQAMLEAITSAYRADGYILSRAVAPPQDLSDGVLQIKVIEGYITAVSFEGVSPERWRLKGLAERIKALRPLSMAAMEEVLFLMEDRPGLSVSPALLAVDDDAGLYELVIESEADLVEGNFYLDNRGTEAVGPFQAYTSLAVNNGLGLAERIQLGFFTVPNQPQELLYFDGQYLQPIGPYGTTAVLSGSRSRSDIGGDLADFDTISRSERVSLGVTQPLIRSRDLNLSLGASFVVNNLEQELLDTRVLEDRLRVGRLRLDGNVTDGLDGTSFLGVEASHGFEILGASEPQGLQRSRFNGEVVFNKVTVEGGRQQNLPWNFALLTSFAGQYSDEALLSAEEFGLGGARFGRGYDYSEVTGDHGVAGSVELQYGLDLPMEWLPGVQFYGFYDWGAVWNELPGGGRARDSLSSAGGGIRTALFGEAQVNLEVGVPLTRTPLETEDKDPRFFFSLSIPFF